jgi:preprotein translocase subunit SecD
MGRAKKILKNSRVVLLLIFLGMALIAIRPSFDSDGVAIRNIVVNSSASDAGISNPKPNSPPMSKEIIKTINNVQIQGLEDYNKLVAGLGLNRSVIITTNLDTYRLITREVINVEELNETELKEITEEVEEIVEFYNETTNQTINKTIIKNVTKEVEVPKLNITHTGVVDDIGIRVSEAPTNNIRKGLDLQGGTRVLLEPEETISKENMNTLIDNMKERLNVYGLSDLVVRQAEDLSGNQFILVEIAGANEEEVKELLAKQGKFEAKIGNNTVFSGGNRDVPYVCRSADCAGIDPGFGCGASQNGGYVCRFRFSITLSQDAADRQAEATKDLEVLIEDNNDYLSEKLVLLLDDVKVDELNIGSDLKGRAVTDIQISGSGAGATEQEAALNSLTNMKRLQTILITGSLPVKLNIVKTDIISPALGDSFLKNALLIGLAAILVVVSIIYLRYRKIQVAVPMLVTTISEVVIILGIASLIGWNLDLAAIAGIIIAVGTGVDHLIILTDETIKGETSMAFNWKERVKRAFFIIIAAYFTTLVAMLPLMKAGAGLLKGFAITTIIGVSIGVFITRPAYAAIVEQLLKE